MLPRDDEETQPSQSVSAWYGKVKPVKGVYAKSHPTSVAATSNV